MSETAEPILKLSDINTFYGQAQVHFDLSIEVPRGHIVCLLGGNASGKSTTMKIILGLLRPRSGEVSFDGASTLDLSTPQIVRRGIASVPEARRLFADMSVREVAFELGLSRRRIYQMIHAGELEMVKIGKASRVPSAAVRRLAGEKVDE